MLTSKLALVILDWLEACCCWFMFAVVEWRDVMRWELSSWSGTIVFYDSLNGLIWFFHHTFCLVTEIECHMCQQTFSSSASLNSDHVADTPMKMSAQKGRSRKCQLENGLRQRINHLLRCCPSLSTRDPRSVLSRKTKAADKNEWRAQSKAFLFKAAFGCHHKKRWHVATVHINWNLT